MSIFNRTSLMESVNSFDVEPYAGEIAPTMESAIEMGAELVEGVYKLNSSLYIADLLLEQRAMAGEDVEHLMESAVGDFFRNLKEKFQKMWAKIKAFFASIGKKIEIFVSTGKHFISTYEGAIKSAIRNKDVKWITYSERYGDDELDKASDNTDDGMDDIKQECDRLTKEMSDILNDLKNSDNKEVPAEEKEKLRKDIEKFEIDLCKDMSAGQAETYSEAREYISNYIQHKKTGITLTLDAGKVTSMLGYVKEYLGKGKANIQRFAAKMNTAMSKLLSCLKKIESDANKVANNGVPAAGLIAEMFGELSKGVSFAQWVSSKITTAAANQYKHYVSVLKAFASKNSRIITRKESYDSLGYESDSLLENILEAF